MPADPFALITKADERLIAQARKRGPAALEKVTLAIARRAVTTAAAKDKKREEELHDSEDRAWPPAWVLSAGKEAKLRAVHWRRRAVQRAERDRCELHRLALHESGHAAVCHLLGAAIERIAVGRGIMRDTLELDGGCFWRMLGGLDIPPAIRLRVSLAGMVADQVFCGRQEDMLSGDARQARASAEAIAEATGRDVDDVMVGARAEVEVLLELSGPETTAILTRAGVERVQPRWRLPARRFIAPARPLRVRAAQWKGNAGRPAGTGA